MADYIAQLAALTDEEQAIYRLGFLEREDKQRLEKIKQARDLLWNAERARKARTPLAEVPLGGWQVDRVGGYKAPRPRRDRAIPRASAPDAPRDLPKGVERTQSGRVRAVCFLRDRTKISFGTFDATAEQIARAGRMAAAARAARDRGLGAAEVRAAAWNDEERYAAD